MSIVDSKAIYNLMGRPLLPEGVHVESLHLSGNTKGPAEEAGIKVGDRIVSITVGTNQRTLIRSCDDVINFMKGLRRGGTRNLTFEIQRDANWPLNEDGSPKTVTSRVLDTLDTQVSTPTVIPGLQTTASGEQLNHLNEQWNLDQCIRELKNLHPGVISLHRFLEYDLWIATQPFIDMVVHGKSRTIYEHLVPMAAYIANGQPKICKAMLQHVSDRENLIKFRRDVITTIGQGPLVLCDSNIEHFNGLSANACKQNNTGKTGTKISDWLDYLRASASNPGLVELDEELESFFLGAATTKKKSERVRTHERVTGDYFKDVRTVILEFLKSLIRSACTGDLDKTWPPINPFDKGKKAALTVLKDWETNQEDHVRSMFSRMIKRRSAEVENQKKMKASADAVLQGTSKSDVRSIPVSSSVLGERQPIHDPDIRNMTNSLAQRTFKDEIRQSVDEIDLTKQPN